MMYIIQTFCMPQSAAGNRFQSVSAVMHMECGKSPDVICHTGQGGVFAGRPRAPHKAKGEKGLACRCSYALRNLSVGSACIETTIMSS
mmetsp:Transcript_37592/g.83710  ORF Transcript_37592/g.83710 Transcript_37592/m.83710 type:complete len:88 (-) Transcript_37592:101-364(-)